MRQAVARKTSKCRYFSRKPAILSSFSSFKRKKALEIPSQTHQGPLALLRTQAAQQELAEALHLLDDAEDGIDRGLALGIAGLALAGAQPMRSGLGRCGLP
jgi:hypothetical protein